MRGTSVVEDIAMILLNPAMLANSLDSYKIVEINRISNFAGRMGQEVRETWKVSKNGQDFTVIVMPYHTHVARTTQFSEGDTVSIRSEARGATIRVTLREVSKS